MSLALLGGGETSPWIDRIWIATDGSDDTGDGSEGNPLLNLNTAINWASAGNIIMVKGGTYTPASLLNVYKSDLTIMAVWGARPVFDATNYPTDGEGGFNDRVMRLQGVDNVTLQGFDLTNGPDGGLQIIGTCSGIRVNAVNAYQNGRTSLYEGEGFVADGAISDLWYTNCDSYENFDELGDVGLNADGFKISTTGTGCGYTYCRAWRNSDDGFDCYNSSQSSSVTVEPVTYEHCWSFENGILAGGSDSLGDGMGFKLGGQRIYEQAVRNPLMAGTVTGSPGTPPTNWSTDTFRPTNATRSLSVETDDDGVVFLVGQMSGTPTASTFAWDLDSTTYASASQGEVWTGRALLKKTAGSLTGFSAFTLAIREYDSGGSFLRQTLTDVSGMTAIAQEYEVSATLGASTAYVTLALRVTTTGAALGCTVGVGRPFCYTGNLSGGNTSRNCLSWGNRENGFTDNDAPIANYILNDTAYDNGGISFETHAVGTEVRDSISLGPGTADTNIADETNVSGNSWQGAGASASDFVSTDDAVARGSRDADGNLPVSDFLRPVSGSVIDGIGGVPT